MKKAEKFAAIGRYVVEVCASDQEFQKQMGALQAMTQRQLGLPSWCLGAQNTNRADVAPWPRDKDGKQL